jgi:hypothetical protein
MVRGLKHFRFIATSSLFLLLGIPSGRAQQITGEIDGTIRDPSGAAIAGAVVTITNTDTKVVVRTLKTNKSGEYAATTLQVGTYKIDAQAEGFEHSEITDISLAVGDTLTRDIKVVPGAMAEVSVTADSERPNIETNENSSLIDNTEMKELALNTRNFEQMLLLQPGVSYGGPDELYSGQIDPTGARNSTQLSINGLQPTQVIFLLDGADMLNHTTNSQTTIFPTIDAIQQIQTVRNNYGAQYGGGGSAQISVVTKAGGADYHGDVYWFYRNAGMDATPITDKGIGGTPIQSKPDLHYDDFGFTWGGPVFIPKIYPRDRSKTFFFYSQEIKRLNTPVQNTVTSFPTLENAYGFCASPACSTVLGNGGTCPAGMQAVKDPNSPFPGFLYRICTTVKQPYPGGAMIDPCPVGAPQADKIAEELDEDQVIPAITSVPLSSTSTDTFQQASSSHETQELLRVDHQFGERLSAFFRYIHDPNTQQIANAIYKASGVPTISPDAVYTVGTDYLGHLTWTARPTMVVEVGFSYLPYETTATPNGTAVAANSPDVNFPNLPFTNTTGRVPAYTIVSPFYGSVGPFVDQSATYEFYENTTQSLGHHVVYFGTNIEHLTDRANSGTNNSGLFSFTNGQGTGGAVTQGSQIDNDFGQFLGGNSTSFTQSSIDPVAQPHENLYEAYIQDVWRTTSRLTLNAGVRYSVFQAPGDYSPNTGGFPNGRLGAFQPEGYVPSNAPTIGLDGNICTSSANGYVSPLCTATGVNGGFSPTNGVVGGGAAPSPYGNAVSRTPLLDFAPRFGFALNMFGDGKTSLRGGGGIFYEQQPLLTAQNLIDTNPAYVQNPVYLNATFENPGLLPAGILPIGYIGGITQQWKQPYVESWNLDVQQQLTKTTILDVGYVGNNTVHLQGEEDLNQVQPDLYITAGVTGCVGGVVTQACIPGSSVNDTTLCAAGVKCNTSNQLNRIRPYLGYAAINYVSTRYFADYNGLQASLINRSSKSLTFAVNYTWSKALSNSGGPPTAGSGPSGNAKQYDAQNRFDLKSEWGSTVLDRRNVLVSNVIYQFPSHSSLHGIVGALANGWEVSGIIQVVSGIWLTSFQTTYDPAGLGISSTGGNDFGRPDLNFSPNNGPKNQMEFFKNSKCNTYMSPGVTPSCMAETDAPTGTAVSPSNAVFVQSGYAGRPGTENIGAILGPGYVSVNMDVFKNIELPENMRLQLRAEAFNLPNHVNWNGVNLQEGAATFGEVTSAHDPREIQVGAKLIF